MQRKSSPEHSPCVARSDTDASHVDDDFSEYDVDQSPLSSPDRGVTRGRLASQLNGEVKRLKIELPPSVIRSFLDDGKRSLKELRDMTALREVADRAAVIVRVCKAHPVQAFYFCVDYPDNCSPSAFLDLKRRSNLAFHLEGMRIMHMLNEEEREKLVDTPLADVLMEFRNRDARLMVLSSLRRQVDDHTALEILNDSACQGRLSVGGEETALAGRLLEFWNERGQTQTRRDRLRSAFDDYEMTLRDSCAFCNAYIEGKVDAETNDVVGISVIASRLRGRRKSVERYLPSCEEELRKCIYVKAMPLQQAVHEAMRKTKDVDRLSGNLRPTTAALLAHCVRPSHYLPFSVMVLRKEIIPIDS